MEKLLRCRTIAFLLGITMFYTGCSEEEEDENPTINNNADAAIQTALNNGTSLEEILDSNSKTKLYGKTYEGGYIAYINESNRLVLICAAVDIADQVAFSDGGNFSLSASTSSNAGQGQSNTDKIIGELGSTGNVAALCNSFSTGGFSDWFLPSKTELGYFRSNVFKKELGNFPGGQTNAKYYWHSTIISCPEATQFVTGTQTCVSSANVRAARYSFY
ncbi:MAG: hypothetical protein RLO81_12130 [Fulvivirga sp.]|uniref:hypothetical protein n=1 Tax=Fulvivirga sp. TaxID=1931237 RepID=UPI0032EF1A10